MAYTPINWQTGDTITAEKLNRCDNGWGVESTQLFSETVTTEDQGGVYGADLTYASVIDAAVIIVTFDGTDYECTMNDMGGVYAYGGVGPDGLDFTDYPFAIASAINVGGTNQLYTETAGTYTISAAGNAIVTSSDFRHAVLSVGALPMLCVSGTTTYDEMDAAKSANRLMYFYDSDGRCAIVADMSSAPINITPAYSDLTVKFDNGNVFTVSIS